MQELIIHFGLHVTHFIALLAYALAALVQCVRAYIEQEDARPPVLLCSPCTGLGALIPALSPGYKRHPQALYPQELHAQAQHAACWLFAPPQIGLNNCTLPSTTALNDCFCPQ